MYGEGVVTDRTCQKWFANFDAGHLSLDGAPRSGRPAEVDSSQIETLRTINVIYHVGDIQHTQYSNQ